MPSDPHAAVWFRYFERRERDGFGTIGETLSMRREAVLRYVLHHSRPAYLAIVEGV